MASELSLRRWLKYGTKVRKRSSGVRHYFRCSVQGCQAKRTIDVDVGSNPTTKVTDIGRHARHCDLCSGTVHDHPNSTSDSFPPSCSKEECLQQESKLTSDGEPENVYPSLQAVPNKVSDSAYLAALANSLDGQQSRPLPSIDSLGLSLLAQQESTHNPDTLSALGIEPATKKQKKAPDQRDLAVIIEGSRKEHFTGIQKWHVHNATKHGRHQNQNLSSNENIGKLNPIDKLTLDTALVASGHHQIVSATSPGLLPEVGANNNSSVVSVENLLCNPTESTTGTT